jgi:hypothetical protein
MISPSSLRNIIYISLNPIGKWSHDAEEILMMIAAHESHMGKYLRQNGGGPARGIYGIEPETEEDTWKSYINYRPNLKKQIVDVSGVSGQDVFHLQYNPIYQTIIARLKLWRSPEKLPPAHEINQMAEYATKYYNCGGKATPDKYTMDYLRYV